MSQKLFIQQAFQAVTTEQLVPENHIYRKIHRFFNFKKICKTFRKLYSNTGAPGYEVEQGIRALILQFMEDYSDREMARALEENIAVKWFCGFNLTEPTPNYSYFTKHKSAPWNREY